MSIVDEVASFLITLARKQILAIFVTPEQDHRKKTAENNFVSCVVSVN